jgi:hypothetical protein
MKGVAGMESCQPPREHNLVTTVALSYVPRKWLILDSDRKVQTGRRKEVGIANSACDWKWLCKGPNREKRTHTSTTKKWLSPQAILPLERTTNITTTNPCKQTWAMTHSNSTIWGSSLAKEHNTHTSGTRHVRKKRGTRDHRKYGLVISDVRTRNETGNKHKHSNLLLVFSRLRNLVSNGSKTKRLCLQEHHTTPLTVGLINL